MSIITGVLTRPSPLLALFGLEIEDFATQLHTVVVHILTAAQLTLLSKWRTNDSPNLSDAVQRVHLWCSYGHFYAACNGRIKIFRQEWEP